MKTAGIIGFGSFGQFMAKHLKPFFDIKATNRSDKSAFAAELGVDYVSLEEAGECDMVIVGTPVQNMESVLERIKDRIKPGALVVDVASVKMKPVELMLKHIPEHAEIIASHPLFGPQSGRNGIKGLECVLCDVRSTRFEKAKDFLADELGLKVLVMTPEEHDLEIAYIQGLTHWISRAVRGMELPKLMMSTPAYEHFLKIEEILRQDSMALFLTIERENPYAKEARGKFLHHLKELENLIREE